VAPRRPTAAIEPSDEPVLVRDRVMQSLRGPREEHPARAERDREPPVLAVPADEPRPALEAAGGEPHHERVGWPVEPLPIERPARRAGEDDPIPAGRDRGGLVVAVRTELLQPRQPAAAGEPGDERVGPAIRLLPGEPPVGRTRDEHV